MSRPIGSGAVWDEAKHDNNVTDLPCAVYSKNDTELSWPIKPSAVCHENQKKHDMIDRTSTIYTENDTKP